MFASILVVFRKSINKYLFVKKNKILCLTIHLKLTFTSMTMGWRWICWFLMVPPGRFIRTIRDELINVQFRYIFVEVWSILYVFARLIGNLIAKIYNYLGCFFNCKMRVLNNLNLLEIIKWRLNITYHEERRPHFTK